MSQTLTQSEYLPIGKMAKMTGYSPDFLRKNIGILFFEGTHFFKKQNRSDWKVSSMIAWIENKNMSTQAKDILKMVS